jgi:hypothetical protein
MVETDLVRQSEMSNEENVNCFKRMFQPGGSKKMHIKCIGITQMDGFWNGL